MKYLYSIAALIAFALGASSQDKKLPADLALVPGDASVFAQLKITDLWNSEAIKDIRPIVLKAGAKLLKELDGRYLGMISNVDRMCAFMLKGDSLSENSFPNPILVVTFKNKIDREKVSKMLAEKSNNKRGKRRDFIADADETVGFFFADDNTIAISSFDGMSAYCNLRELTNKGPIAPGLELAVGTRPIVVAFSKNAIGAGIWKELDKEIPKEVKGALEFDLITISAEVDKNAKLVAQVHYAEDKTKGAKLAFQQLEVSAMQFIEETRKTLEKQVNDKQAPKGDDGQWKKLFQDLVGVAGLGALQFYEDYLNSKPIKQNGNVFTLELPLPLEVQTFLVAGALQASTAAPMVGQLARITAGTKSSNNLKQMALAMHNYHDVNDTFPLEAIKSKDGKPLLSWRVAILPYIEQDNLYRQFKLDEPWDSENNKKLIPLMPKIYLHPMQKDPKAIENGLTNYRLFVGPNTVFDNQKKITITNITDGTSNTWMMFESSDSTVWTKPGELTFNPQKPGEKLGKFFNGGFYAALCDGSVRFYKRTPMSIQWLIDPADGMVIGDDD